MELIYSDESGTSFTKNDDGTYRDGEFVIYGGFSVDENKYWHLERTVFNIAKDIFAINSSKDIELHAGDIFWRRGSFEGLGIEQSRRFFNEIVQFIAKYGVNIYLGLIYKKSKLFNKPVEFLASSMECFLQLVEKNLSDMAKNGILIADMSEEISGKRKGHDPWEFLNNSNLEGEEGGPRSENLLKRMFFDTQSWKEIFSSIPHTPYFDRRYRFEKRSHYLLDNIHYVDSRTSILTQLADILLFIINRIFSYTTLNYYEVLKRGNKKDFYSSYEYGLDWASANVLFESNILSTTIFKCLDSTLDLQYLPKRFFKPTGYDFNNVFFERIFVISEPHIELPRPI